MSTNYIVSTVVPGVYAGLLQEVAVPVNAEPLTAHFNVTAGTGGVNIERNDDGVAVVWRAPYDTNHRFDKRKVLMLSPGMPMPEGRWAFLANIQPDYGPALYIFTDLTKDH